MKYLIGCLAGVGLVVILFMAGCMGLIGFGLASIPKKPPYANVDIIEKEYESDLQKIRINVEANTASLNSSLSKEVIAIYDEDKEILGRIKAKDKSYFISNGSGTGTVDVNGTNVNCVVYEVKINAKAYRVFIIDRRKND
jgi:flagellar biosynthesis component FlhA